MLIKNLIAFSMLSALAPVMASDSSCAVSLLSKDGKALTTFESFEENACDQARYSCLERLSEGLLSGEITNAECGSAIENSNKLTLSLSAKNNNRPGFGNDNRPGFGNGPGYGNDNRPGSGNGPGYGNRPGDNRPGNGNNWPGNRPGHGNGPGTRPNPSQPSQYSCTTDLIDGYSRIIRSYSEVGYTLGEACQRTEKICRVELQRGNTNARACVTRNSNTTPTRPVPPRQVSESCAVNRVDRFTGVYVSETYRATATAFDQRTAKEYACQEALRQCDREVKVHQMCVVR